MKVILVNGSLNKDGATNLALEEGFQTMKTLGKNMTWILKYIEKGKEKGVQYPEKEKKNIN